MKTNLDFGQALEALKQGERVQREGWNGKGLFVFKQVDSYIPIDIMYRMQSLPNSVKEEFDRRAQDGCRGINYSNQLALVNTDNVITGWAPSVSDSLANDWVVL